MHFPDDVSMNSPWAFWIWFLAQRWNYYTRYSNPYASWGSNGSFIDILEFVNEPNQQMWPQTPPSQTPNPWDPGPSNIAVCHVANMFATARQIVAGLGNSPLLAGPATSDTPTLNTRLRTKAVDFTDQVLSVLGGSGFQPTNATAWSAHNYREINNGDVTIQQIRAKLANRWAGWRWNTWNSDPSVLLTEGGGYLDQGEAGQALRLGTNVQKMHNDDPAQGAGVAMLSQYLEYTDPNFDVGLAPAWNPPAQAPAFRLANSYWGPPYGWTSA
jgi:hypothetical protein